MLNMASLLLRVNVGVFTETQKTHTNESTVVTPQEERERGKEGSGQRHVPTCHLHFNKAVVLVGFCVCKTASNHLGQKKSQLAPLPQAAGSGLTPMTNWDAEIPGGHFGAAPRMWLPFPALSLVHQGQADLWQFRASPAPRAQVVLHSSPVWAAAALTPTAACPSGERAAVAALGGRGAVSAETGPPGPCLFPQEVAPGQRMGTRAPSVPFP